ncbi:hypothetical protein A2876_01385 [Candidatus Amesbacteria bacterium RIFCSPHIGHO2_01_FULL_48_32b]|uniref:Peptidase n=1 Tax=Candidatus Amesbacteria bacterium RIFCSPHIGHO2_01_FULL_48_32b TaxID=1797253 RepID=A0A1F4YCP6_9BACT|nr:MAG: hypothetical protein A2876_01385 [Candidatus Amesbacteria bacterium RIFCSPHIGHO2_01_FULL_48_32b]
MVLVGSGEFTEAMLGIDKRILDRRDKPLVAIVPLAAKQEVDYWKWVDNGVKHFAKLGIEAYGAETAGELKRTNAVYFSGGDPGYLLEQVKNGKLWEEAAKKAIVFGSSAGAMLMGEWVLANIYAVIDRGEKNLRWERAMGVVPYTIWPHFDSMLKEFREKWNEAMDRAPEDVKTRWLGIDEDTAVIFEPGKKPRVLGKGKAHWGRI